MVQKTVHAENDGLNSQQQNSIELFDAFTMGLQFLLSVYKIK